MNYLICYIEIKKVRKTKRRPASMDINHCSSLEICIFQLSNNFKLRYNNPVATQLLFMKATSQYNMHQLLFLFFPIEAIIMNDRAKCFRSQPGVLSRLSVLKLSCVHLKNQSDRSETKLKKLKFYIH